jgi:ABC-2 type transport system permease protein
MKAGIMKLDERIKYEFKGALVIARKDIRIYYFKAPVLIFGIVFPCFLFLAFALGRNIPTKFLVPGMIGMSLFFTASSVGPIIIPWETRARTLERLLSCPISIQSTLLGDIIAGSLFGVAISFVALLLGVLGLGVNVLNIYVLILTILISAFCFAALSILVSASPTDNPSNVMMLSNLVRLPLIFISGVFIPVEQLPSGGRIVAMLSPLTYTTDLLRRSLQGFNYYPIGLDFVMLFVFMGIFLILGMKFHKRSLSKRI